jgi:hypothetical protein
MQPIECDILEPAPMSALGGVMDGLVARTTHVIVLTARGPVVYDLTDPGIPLPRFRSLIPWVPTAEPPIGFWPPLRSLWRIMWAEHFGEKSRGIAP